MEWYHWFKKSLVGITALIASATALSAARVIEIAGPPDTTCSRRVQVPEEGETLWLRVHGVVSPEIASVRVNEGPWIPLNNSTCALEGIATNLNGIGGPLDTLSFTVPSAVLIPGTTNTVDFRINATTGSTTSYRVLEINVVDGAGTKLLPSTPPSAPYISVFPSIGNTPQETIDERRALGGYLWTNAALVTRWTGDPIRAHCADCHAGDGRDLKYFNYSSRSIIERARFHGLDTNAGTAIAAFIEANPSERLGQVWDPPYQPAPGLDSLPVSHWSAGGGIAAVATNETATWNALFPDGIPSFDFSATINVRELPVNIPLPDWNSWLPSTHPLDYWGDSFQPVDDAFKSLKIYPPEWFPAMLGNAWATYYQWASQYRGPMNGDDETDPHYQMALYGLARWRLIRMWDALQTLNLEASGKDFYPWAESAERVWPGGTTFLVAPHMSMTSHSDSGLRDGTIATAGFRSFQWYWLQLVQNDSNHRRNGSSPIDWGYFLSFASGVRNSGIRSEALLIAAMAKAGEAGTGDPYGPWNQFLGFNGPRLEFLSSYEIPSTWEGYDPAWRDSIVRAFVKEYSKWVRGFGRDYFINYTYEINPYDNDTGPTSPMAGPWIRSHALTIRWYGWLGWAPDIIEDLREIGQDLWPDADWNF
jgi:hypothetical protein